MYDDLILSVVYAFNKFGVRPTRRLISTFLYVFLEGELDIEDVYPDGVESYTVNLIVDSLIEAGLIYSDWGYLKALEEVSDRKLEEFVNSFLKKPLAFWLGVSSFLLRRQKILNNDKLSGEEVEERNPTYNIVSSDHNSSNAFTPGSNKNSK